ncbi:MAG: beta-galactosidase [Acidobacteriia bacterium]|nr:beta-galactosidase [Terriglobia bacterium]
MKRIAAVLVALAALGAAPAPAPPAAPTEFVQAVEFPYYLFPRALWDRELVWLKSIGVRTVEFSIPWNWHQLRPDDFDFTGRTSPRRDLVGLIRTLRKLGLQAWVRPLPPVAGWRDNGWPSAGSTPAAQRAWIRELERLLGTQTVRHGGPVAYVEGRASGIDAPPPPAPVNILSAPDRAAFDRSRGIIEKRQGALLWTGVEDELYPQGWAADPGSPLVEGAVGLAGNERTPTTSLRRDSALLRNWAPLFPRLRPAILPKPAAGKLPPGVSAVELVSPVAAAVSITNTSEQEFHDDLRVLEPASGRTLVIPGVTVPRGESLWLPVNVSIGLGGLCRECANFSGAEHIVYATAELLSVEFENGILAMEFAAPVDGEVVLQLARQPVGPYLAGGKPAKFDWDDKNLRARLTIPAGEASGNRVRIGMAIEEPDTSGFFDDARRLLIGQTNTVSTVYSSADVAARSRLLLPEGFSAKRVEKSPNEIDYEVAVPAEALHGDWANLALEADGMPLGRSRLQLFRPVTVRLFQAMQLHFGQQAELTPEPPTAPVEPKAGSNVEVLVRNNSREIQTYRLEAAGNGLEFLPAKAEISVGPLDERSVNFRVFGKEGGAGLREWRLRLSGGATADLPMGALLLPRNATVAWSADLDGDGSPEWLLESQKARAVFSSQDGGRWIDFTWKDGNMNFLPARGAFAAPGPVEVRAEGDALQFVGKGWTRTARLAGSTLAIEQDTPLPADRLAPDKRGNTSLSIERPSPSKAIYTLK